MDFWSAYYKESLGQPWVIQSKNAESSAQEPIEPVHPTLFLTLPIQQEALKSMMQKMAVAIKLSSDDVSFVEVKDLSIIEAWGSPKKIMVFGKNFLPEHFGQAINKAGHQVMVTHSLSDLNKQPELKKETWEHLKTFARLS